MSHHEQLKPAVRRPADRRRLQNPNPQMRVRLMDAAAELLRECRFPELRVEDVARRAGASVGTFYLYFDDKQDLFLQLVREFSERLRQRLNQADPGAGSIRVRLAKRLSAYLDFVSENPGGFLHYRDGGAIDTNLGPLATWAATSHAVDLRPILAQGIASGELRPTDPELLSHALTGLIQHLAGHWLEHPGAHSREEIELFLMNLIAFGIDAGAANAVGHRGGQDGAPHR